VGAVNDSSLAPSLLVAMPQLLDPNFRRAVVLLVSHDDAGTFGVVLNRITEITAQNLCDSIDIEWRGDSRSEIYWGGPVQPQTGWVLFSEGQAPGGSDDVTQVTDGVRLAGSLSVLRDMASEPPGQLRLLLGYAGWGPGQLEAELAEGAWLVAPAESGVVFDVEPAEMWAYVVRSLGIEPATLVPSRGIH
jgi:putative transcriptional regulator